MEKITTFLFRLLENLGCIGFGVFLLVVYVIAILFAQVFGFSYKDVDILIAVAAIIIALINTKAIISHFIKLWGAGGHFFIGWTLIGLYMVVASYSGIIDKGMNGENLIGVAVGLLFVVIPALYTY